MSHEKRSLDAEAIDPDERHRILSSLIVPRPIGWVGTRGEDGVANLAPFSFFAMVAGTPPTVMFAPGLMRRVKDTLTNTLASGEFSLNLVSEDLAEAMNVTSGEYPPEVDEFALAGLTALDGEVTGAPLVAEAKANMECRLFHTIRLGDPPTAVVILGEVLRIHVRADLLEGAEIDQTALGAVGKMAGSSFVSTRHRFEMPRPS
jgi:flavin reductase (DIM6/NTAB) family NADH-FMN oxidoreductase RutF